MKSIWLIMLCTLYFNAIKLNAQKIPEAAVAIGAGAFGIFQTAAAIDAFIEGLEQNATNWILSNKPEYKEFELKLLNLKGESFVDISGISCITFKVTPKGFDKIVLIWVVDPGWYNTFGVDLTKVHVEIFNRMRWNEVFLTYLNLCSNYTISSLDSIPFYDSFAGNIKYAEKKLEAVKALEGKNANPNHLKLVELSETSFSIFGGYFDISQISNLRGSGIQAKLNDGRTVQFPYRKLNGDTYVVGENDSLRVVFNERSVNLFFKSLGALVKIRRNAFEDISSFLMGIEV